MKIGIVCYPSVGGSGIVATELGKSLSRHGHEVHFYSYDIPTKLENACETFHFHHVDVPFYPLFRFPPYTIALASKIYETAKENPLDILHVHYAVPHSTSAFLAKHMLCSHRVSVLKVITTLHGTDTALVGQMPSYKPVVEYSIDFSDAVTTVSQYLKEQTLDDFTINQDIHVVYNPIDTDIFTPPQDKSKSDVKTVVHISNFRPVKRIEDTIKVFDLIAASMPAQLLFVGEGPELAPARELVGQLGLLDKVQFLGRRRDVETILQQADLLLSTSETESFGMSIAEAMSCEVPVVATNVGGVPEVVEDEVTGFLSPVGSITQLAEDAIRLLTTPGMQEQYGKAARQRIMDRFHIDKITKDYEKIYQQVLDAESIHCPERHRQEMEKLAAQNKIPIQE